MGIRDVAQELGAAVVSIIWPQYCVGCSQEGALLCLPCHDQLGCTLIRRDSADLTYPPPAPLWQLGLYRGTWRKLIIAWKHTGAPQLTQVIRGVVQAQAQDFYQQLLAAGLRSDAPLYVIPAPSRWKRRFARKLVVRTYADHLARSLSNFHPTDQMVVMADVLRQRGRADHGLNRQCRGQSRRGSMHCLVPLPGFQVVLVDDVVTTGATAREGLEVLGAAGAQLVGMLALAGAGAPGKKIGTNGASEDAKNV